ncbi:MAG: tetratricopeptide repeat protein [Alphaproteobacteria bacterium]|nr:tetratricopeptide repeat protein [Alphaproteobacteria bacterium]
MKKEQINQSEMTTDSPLQAEILREVTEEIKEEQLKKIFKKFSPIFISLALLALLTTAGIEYSKYYHKQKSLKEASQLYTAIEMMQQGKREISTNLLNALAQKGDVGYKSLALMYSIQNLIQQGKNDEAIQEFDNLSSNSSIPEALKNYATIEKTYLLLEKNEADYDQLKNNIEHLTKDNNVWSADALELYALISLRQNDYVTAQRYFEKILTLTKVSESKRMRASEFLASIKEKL